MLNASHGLMALYLVCLLSVPKVQSVLAALVCLTAMVASRWQTPPPVGVRLRQSLALFVPLAAYGALVLGQILAGMLKPKDADQLLMCLLTAGVLLSWVPRAAPSPRKWLFPAAAVGAIGAFGLAAWQVFGLDIERPYGHLGVGKIGNGAIKFGDLAGLLGLFSLLMLVDGAHEPRWRKVLGVLGCAAGLAALGMSQARGGVLGVALALWVLILLLYVRRRARRRQLSALAADGSGVPTGAIGASSSRVLSRPPRLRGWMAAVLGAVVLVGAVQWMAPRFADIGPQIERFQAGDQNSEVGQRLALWGVAWRAGLHAPLTGIGIDGFAQELDRQRATGEVPADMLVLYGSAHNEYLAAFAGAGVPGLVVILLLFIGPMVVGIRRFLAGQRPDAALALVMLSTAFSAYSLTDAMFERQISMLAYLLLAAWLMAASGTPASQPVANGGGNHA
ncbi:MAG: O-antigen ligase family protein [Lautropia sp.]|nr:O-antigen ligase family protein [Lautropia sp.]